MNAEKQKTILLVEDEAIIAMAEKKTLEKFGYNVILAGSGEEAVATAAQTPAIDLILMDIDLGKGMDGTEAAALILKERDLPVVFLSSHMEPEIVEKTEKITSYGYVVKNSSATVLDASIKMAFKLFDAKIKEKEKESALQESEEIMRYIVKHDPNAIAVYDRSLRYIAVSDRYLKDYNVRETDIIGRHHYDIFPELPQKWKDVHQRCLAGAIERNDDDHFERPDGSITYNRWECRPWRRVDGEIGGIITYTEVTTERKLAELKLAQNLDLLTKLARLVPGVIYQYRLDPDGRSAFPYASPGMNDIYEVTPEEVRDDAALVFTRLHPDDYDMVADAIQASALTLNTFYCEFRVLLPRQGLRWRWSQAHPERLPDGGTLWHGIILDITERKLAEVALRESEEQFRTLATMAPIGIYLTDTQGRCRYANPRWCEMAGLTLEETLGDGWTRGLHPDDRDAVFAAWQKTVESQGRWGLEYRFQSSAGKVTWVQGLAAAQRDAQGAITGYVGANIDITQRKLAEEALKDSEARSQALLSAIPDMLFRVNSHGVFLDYQAESRDLYYQSEASFIGKSCREILPPDLADLIESKSRSALESGALQTFIYQLPVPGKGMRDFEARMIASGADEVTAIVRDISETRETGRTLREAEERWRDILFSMADWVWEVDENGVYTYSSEKGEALLGYSRDEILGKTPFDFMPPGEAQRVGAIFSKIIANKEVIRDLENWNLGKNGERICLLTNGVPILDENGNLKGYRGVDKDITGRKRAEAAIQDSLAFQQALLDAVPSPIFYKDAHLVYIGGNKAFENYLGLPREQFIGKTVFDIAPADLAERYDKADRELLQKPGVQTYEASVVYADGTRHEVIFHKAPFADAQGRVAGLIGVILDISERKLAEKALREGEETYRSILNTSPDGISITDMEGRILIASPALVTMMGCEREEEMQGRLFSDFVSPDDRERVASQVALMFQRTMMGLSEYHGLRADGSVVDVEVNGGFIRDARGGPTRMVFIIRDIGARKRAEKALRESEERFHSLFDNMAEGVALHELVLENGRPANYRIIDVNNRFLKIIGVERAQVVGKLATDTYGTTEPPYLDIYAGVALGRVPQYLETYVASMDKHFAISVAPWQQNGFATLFSDVGERKHAEEALRISEAQQANALQMTNAGHWEYDVDNDRFTFNDNFYRIFRTTAAAVGSYQMSSAEYARRFLHPEDMAMVAIETRGAIETSDPNYSRQIEHRILYADGEVGHIAVRFFVVKDARGRTIKTYGVNQDISDRKRAQQEIQRQLTEKEILLKEVHHRIKNNFASVSGLLSLRLQTVTNPEAAAVLKDAASRVDSMRLLYDKLLLSEGYKDISVKNYVESLAPSVITLFPDSARVTLDQRIDDFQLDAKRLFPLGIIINELLTNAMKYAFRDGKKGAVRISLARAHGRVTLTVQDDGPGLPDGFDPEKSQGFGLMLVKMLSDQLGGSFAIDRHQGARCRVEFPV